MASPPTDTQEEDATDLPSLHEFLAEVAPKNPRMDRADLSRYWNDHYGHVDPATLPTRKEFIPEVKAKNPDLSDEELNTYWDDHYGALGAARETPPDKPFWNDAKEVGRQIVAGAVTDLPKMTGQAIQAFTPEDSAPHQFGKEMAAAAKLRENGWEPDREGRGSVADAFIRGGRSIAPSLATMAAYLNPAGAVLGPLATIALFGGSQYQEERDKVLEAGGTQDEARNAGLITGAIQGGGEAIANKLTLGVFGAGKDVAKAGMKGVLGGATETSTLKPWLKATGAAMVGEPATEIAQDLGTSATERAYGLKTPSFADTAYDSGTAALGMTALLAPLGLAGHYKNAARATAIDRILANPNAATPEERQTVVSMLHDEATSRKIPDADQWMQQAMGDVQHGRPIRREVMGEEAATPTVNDIMAAPDVDSAIAHMQAMVSAPGSASGERVTDPGVSQDPDVARLTRQIERGGTTGPVGSASGPDLGTSQAEPNALNALIERGGALPNQAELTQSADRTRQPFDAPVLNGPGPLDQPAIQPGQAFTPRTEPQSDPRAAIQAERNQLIAQRESAINAHGTDQGIPEGGGAIPVQPDSQAPIAQMGTQQNISPVPPTQQNISPVPPTQQNISPVPTKQVEAPERKQTVYKLNPVQNIPAPVLDNPSVQDLHALAAQKGFNIDGTVFRELTRLSTGRKHLDDLTPKQRLTFANTLQKIPEKAYSSPVKPKPNTQPVDLPTGQTATESSHAQTERLAIQLKEFSHRFQKAGSMAGKVRTGEAGKLAVMLDAAKVPYTTRTNRSKDIVTFLHVKDKPFQLGGYFKDELKPSESTHQPMPPQPEPSRVKDSPAVLPSQGVQVESPSPEAALIAHPTPIQAEKSKLQKKPKAEHPSENYRLLPVKTREKFEAAFTGAETADRPSMRTLKEWIDPGNKTLRAEFERRSGVKLPKGLAATNAAVEEYFKKPVLTGENISHVPIDASVTQAETKPAQEDTREPFSLTAQDEANPKAKGPEQLSIDVPPTQVAGQPIIGREAQLQEAPLFSKDAQTPQAEQTAIPETPTDQTDIPIHYESIPNGIMINVKGIRASTGQEISVKEDAASALRRLDETLVQYRQLHKCVNG